MSTPSTERTHERLPLELGSTVEGRYELISVLGVGGFGVVYKATQTTTGQLVALKVLRGGAGGDINAVEMARFEREMKLIGKIKHPHIVRLIDFGRLDGGLLFMVIEYVNGETMSELLRREGGLRPRESKRFMSQILFALHAVHEHGVVYRDLKPANIMISSNGPHRDATILDFGISGLADKGTADGDIQDLTMDGSIRGTPGYMAPELLKQQLASPQSDIYAWGLVFLETLMSRRVITADSSVEVMAKQISGEPVPIPQEILEAPCGPIIQKAVAKDLSQRWKDTAEIIGYFEECEMAPSFHLPWTGLPAMQALKEAASRPILNTGDIGSGTFGTNDIDSSLLIPVAEEELSITSMPAEEAKGLSTPVIVLGGLVIIALIGVGIMLNSGGDPTEPVGAPAVELPAGEAPVAKAPADFVQIDLEAKPASAVFILDGKQAATGRLRLNHIVDGQTHTLRVESPGFTPELIQFTDTPPEGVIELQALNEGEAAKTPKAKTVAPRPVAPRPVTRTPARTVDAPAMDLAPAPAPEPSDAAEEPVDESGTVMVEEPKPKPPKKKKKEEAKPEAEPTKEFAPVLKVTPDPWAEKKSESTPDPWAK